MATAQSLAESHVAPAPALCAPSAPVMENISPAPAVHAHSGHHTRDVQSAQACGDPGRDLQRAHQARGNFLFHMWFALERDHSVRPLNVDRSRVTHHVRDVQRQRHERGGPRKMSEVRLMTFKRELGGAGCQTALFSLNRVLRTTPHVTSD